MCAQRPTLHFHVGGGLELKMNKDLTMGGEAWEVSDQKHNWTNRCGGAVGPNLIAVILMGRREQKNFKNKPWGDGCCTGCKNMRGGIVARWWRWWWLVVVVGGDDGDGGHQRKIFVHLYL